MITTIKVENLSKSYRLGQIGSSTLREDFSRWWAGLRKRPDPYLRIGEADHGNRKGEYIWALRDVDFSVFQGQVLGIIGRNGAGKSTLLKILSRITAPTSGQIKLNGRVASLLEVGTGFHPELTGRENTYLNGAILGMNRKEIDRKFDEIVDFAGINPFIDTPVKRYSSGMFVRLAFAVAAHLDPEILVVDEVLAVGDAEFQRKSLGKMSAVAKEGRTVLFVSHNMSAILRLTEQAIVLEKGRLVYSGETPSAVDHYMASGFAQAGERIWSSDEVPSQSAPFRPLALRMIDSAGRVIDTMRSTEPIVIEMEYHLDEPISGLRVGLYLQTSRGELIFTTFDTDSIQNYEKHTTRPAGRYTSRCTLPADFLNEGHYFLGVNASSFRVKSYFHDEHSLTFNVDITGAPGMQWPRRAGDPYARAWNGKSK